MTSAARCELRVCLSSAAISVPSSPAGLNIRRDDMPETTEDATSPRSAEVAALYAQKQRLIEMLNSEKLDAELRALQAAASDDDDDDDAALVSNLDEQTYDAGPLEPQPLLTWRRALVAAMLVAYLAFRGPAVAQLLQSAWPPDNREL